MAETVFKRTDIAEPVVESPVVELKLGRRRVVLVQRLGEAIRITTAHREERSVTPALVLGGTVFIPVSQLTAVMQAVRKVVRSTK